MRTSFLILFLALLSPVGVAIADGRSPAIPAKFLHADDAAWQQFLACKVTAYFGNPKPDILARILAEITGATIVATRDGITAAPPYGFDLQRPDTFTRTFKEAPLREVLYRLAGDSGLRVDWLILPSGERAIAVFDINRKYKHLPNAGW